MSVARVTEISSTSSESFEDAIREGIERATKTLRNVEGAWVKDMNVLVEDGNITTYKVNLAITFVLEDGWSADIADQLFYHCTYCGKRHPYGEPCPER
jgi:flavin-binding protein dodecin